MLDTKTVIEALLCSSDKTGAYECKRWDCPYFAKESDEDIEAFQNKHKDVAFPDDFWSYCDSDAIMKDAAGMLYGYEEAEEVHGGWIV